MIRIGGKKIVGGYLGTKPIKALYLGKTLVWPEENTPEPVPGVISLNPVKSVILAHTSHVPIMLHAETAWNIQVLES